MFPALTQQYKVLFDGNCNCGGIELMSPLHSGWYPLVSLLLEKLQECKETGQRVRIRLIKEKWGSLRIQGEFSEAAREICEKISEYSEETCAVCGNPGVIMNAKGYYLALCTTCFRPTLGDDDVIRVKTEEVKDSHERNQGFTSNLSDDDDTLDGIRVKTDD
jgi:ribosomal protein S14